MKLTHKIVLGISLPFALAVSVLQDYNYDKYRSPQGVAKLKTAYDRDVVPALRNLARSRCGDTDVDIHGLLAAKFIFDSNQDDDVRKLLKSKRVDPQHASTEKQDGGDGYMTIQFAHKLAAYLLKHNIGMTVEPDRYNGERQLEYLNNGVVDGRLVIYYQPAADGSDRIDVPTSPALIKFLNKLMKDKHTDIAMYRIIKDQQAEGGWRLHKEKLAVPEPVKPATSPAPASKPN